MGKWVGWFGWLGAGCVEALVLFTPNLAWMDGGYRGQGNGHDLGQGLLRREERTGSWGIGSGLSGFRETCGR